MHTRSEQWWLHGYRGLTWVSAPAIRLWLERRRRLGKETSSSERFGERLGQATCTRPDGPLLWCHAASVGESFAVLPLLKALRTRYPSLDILLTTGTVSSAQLLVERLPEGCIHQYAPIDQIHAVRRFLDHWKPDCALFVESELWPNLLAETHTRGCPIVLVNARMSCRSYSRWRHAYTLARALLKRCALVLAQSLRDADRFRSFGISHVRHTGNIKLAADPLPADPEVMSDVLKTIGDRMVWLAASTHPGEERIIGEAHRLLKDTLPSLLTIIVPRHASRGEEIAAMLDEMEITCARRSQGDAVTDETDIYLADTMGELGIFYRLTGIALVGGSLVRHGGQNPIEPALLDCALLTGPHMENFSEIMRLLDKHEAVIRVGNAKEIAWEVRELLTDAERQEALAEVAHEAVREVGDVLNETVQALAPFIPIRPADNDTHDVEDAPVLEDA